MTLLPVAGVAKRNLAPPTHLELATLWNIMVETTEASTIGAEQNLIAEAKRLIVYRLNERKE